MTESRSISFSLIARVALAVVLTFALLVFLAAARLSRASQAPTLMIRSLETTSPVSLPAPPPPPEVEQTPPPVQSPDLPKLDIRFDPVAPAIKAARNPELKLQLDVTNFAPQVEQAREYMTFSSKNLDSQPRLISRPTVPFPKSQQARGVKEGRVTLEVLIRPSGKVIIRNVIKSSHPEFTEMARLFATGSRFTPPRKDGRAVTALFKWPLILRP
ncbi:MAG: hypothetical protein GXP30_06160 [Verrucomicrobia bacterium]|nr:hypothetical protein [Verrucomicrobiota bacterium]